MGSFSSGQPAGKGLPEDLLNLIHGAGPGVGGGAAVCHRGLGHAPHLRLQFPRTDPVGLDGGRDAQLLHIPPGGADQVQGALADAAALQPQQTGDLRVALGSGVELLCAAGVEAHHIGQQDAVGPAMGDVEPGAQGVGHAVVEAQAGVGEGDARQAGGIVHPLPGLAVLGVLIGGQQVALDQLDGLFRRRVGEVGGLGGHKGLHRMGEHVDAGVRRHGRGHAGGQLRVQNGDVGQQAVLHQGIFDPLLLVGDHRKAAHLRAGFRS